MSTLSKSLEKRVQELRASIEAQQKELTAYERVLELESGKGVAANGGATVMPVAAAPAPAVESGPSVEYNGSRSDFVASILKHRAASGATPQEIAKIFDERKIAISKNLIYNVVSLLFKQKKVKKSGGRYYYTAKGAAAPAPTPSAAAPKKRRISEEGMRRIIAATKKRWAAARAAKAKKAAK